MNGQQVTGRIVLDADGMRATLAARARRLFGLVAVAAALALLLGGLAADPAAAEKTREQAVTEANQFIDDCFAAGGDPTVIADAEIVHVQCTFPTGSFIYCNFMNEPSCVRGLTRPPAPNRGVGGVVDEGAVLDGGANPVSGTVGGGVLAGEAEAQR